MRLGRLGFGLIAIAGLEFAQTTGTIEGQVVDEHLRPIVGATVSISAVPRAGVKFQPHLTSAVSERHGIFRVSAPSGVFRICAQLPGSELLDSCVWSRTPVEVAVTGPRTVLVPPVVLRRGYAVTVEVEDAQQVLRKEAGKKSGPRLNVALAAPNGMYVPLKRNTKATGADEFVAFIPRDTGVGFSLEAQRLKIKDDKDKELDLKRAHKFEARIAGEKSPKRFKFRITGVDAN
jgi:hypothetical protein